jgi:hypothetical protein
MSHNASFRLPPFFPVLVVVSCSGLRSWHQLGPLSTDMDLGFMLNDNRTKQQVKNSEAGMAHLVI